MSMTIRGRAGTGVIAPSPLSSYNRVHSSKSSHFRESASVPVPSLGSLLDPN